MKKILLAALAFLAPATSLAEETCLLDLELENKEWKVKEKLFDGREFRGMTPPARERLFAGLHPDVQDMIVRGLSGRANDHEYELGDLLTKVADQRGEDLQLLRLDFRRDRKIQIYRFSIGQGDNEYGYMFEVIGTFEVPGQPKRSMIRTVTEIHDGETLNCHPDFRKE